MASGPGQIVVQPQVAQVATPTAGPFGPLTPVPFSNAPYFTQTTGVPTPPSGANLLSADRPTLLTRWDIERLYMPFLVASNATEATGMICVVTAQLVRNSIAVWTGESSPLTGFLTTGGGDTFWAGIISDDLVNTIRIKRGDSLSMRVSVSTSPTATGILEIQVGVAFSAAGLSSYKADPTVIDYEVSVVPGVMAL